MQVFKQGLSILSVMTNTPIPYPYPQPTYQPPWYFSGYSSSGKSTSYRLLTFFLPRSPPSNEAFTRSSQSECFSARCQSWLPRDRTVPTPMNRLTVAVVSATTAVLSLDDGTLVKQTPTKVVVSEAPGVESRTATDAAPVISQRPRWVSGATYQVRLSPELFC